MSGLHGHPLRRLLLLIISWGLISCRGAVSAELEVDQPLAPVVAAQTMQVPDGFRVQLFAGEPDVRQPISFCLDDRGRLWVAEAYNYPHHGTRPGDRILILEDTDGDGRFDQRTIFYDQLNYVTGIEVGFGGAWVMSPPNFYFIPDRNGDDVPDSEPQVLLTGFGNHANAHNLANGFAWGPDGWLYGTHGRTNWSRLGPPGSREEDRIRFDGGVYRYHPVRHVWEPFADGTTNPWGIDWNDVGDAFVCNCVNPHLFQVIQGAHYEPWRNRESSRYAYQRIATIADHLHFAGGRNVRAGLGTEEEDLLGGGHAHCGTMVYLGDNWPAEYRNQVFMNNIHGRRINHDILRRSGSGYAAAHGRDVMRARDPWYMGVTLQYGPDGAVYASDWSDTGECHSVRNTRRQTGRIYRITYGSPAPADVDLQELSNADLVGLQLHQNDWYVRHARRLLQERAAAGQAMDEVHRQLLAMYRQQTEVPRQLRALWALFVTDGLNEQFLLQQCQHSSEYIRSWAIRLLCQQPTLSRPTLDELARLAAGDDTPYVRLQLASSLQRIPPDDRWIIAAALMQHQEDADDANLPLMYWYGVEPLVHDDLSRFVGLLDVCRIPLLRQFVARRAVEAQEAAALALLVNELTRCAEPSRADIMRGMVRGLQGRRRVAAPPGWSELYAKLRASTDPAITEQAFQLALVLDEPGLRDDLRAVVSDRSAAPDQRNRAIQLLLAKHDPGFDMLLVPLIQDPATQRTALRGLADYDHPETAPQIIGHYQYLNSDAQTDALQTLVSRVSWATELLTAVEEDRIPRQHLNAYLARQLHNLGDAKVAERTSRVWGELRETDTEKRQRIAQLKRRLTPDELAEADLHAGRQLFAATCAKCHQLFNQGERVGPDLTGAQRSSLDYLLENIIDPNAAVSHDYQMEIIETTGGRIISGLVTAENNNALTLRTLNEEVVIPTGEIASRNRSHLSVMPEGLMNDLSFEQLRDLIAYLQAPRQVEDH